MADVVKNKYPGKIGIDLGTTNCVVSYKGVDNKLHLIDNQDGKTITPSFLYMKATKVAGKNKVSYLVGDKAKAMVSSEPQNVLSSYKPYMGTNKVIKELAGKKATSLHGSMLMLRYLRQSAEKYLNETIIEAVITVPAYFTENQKSATIEAAKLAGFTKVNLVPEPSAASFYYTKRDMEDKIVLVYDLGGGTFDLSLVCLMEYDNIVLDIDGDNHLGGDLIDVALARTILGEIFENASVNTQEKYIRLFEKIKIKVSDMIVDPDTDTIGTRIEIPISTVDKRYKNITVLVSEIDTIIKRVLKRTEEVLKRLLSRTSVAIDEIEEVILVGGSTRLPQVKELLQLFNKNWKIIEDRDFPDYAVGYGAGIYLEHLVNKNKSSITNVIPMPIGVGLINGEMDILLQASTQMPCSALKTFTNGDNSGELHINIYEGFSKIAEDNERVGYLSIKLPEVIQRGKYNIDVSLRVTADGVLKAKMVDQSTGDTKQINIVREYSSLLDDVQNLSNNLDSINPDNLDIQEDPKLITSKGSKPTSKSKIAINWDKPKEEPKAKWGSSKNVGN